MRHNRVLLGLFLLVILLFLSSCDWRMLGIYPEPPLVETLQGSTDRHGEVLFRSKSLERDVKIQCVDEAVGTPIEGLKVNFANDGVNVIAVVTDPQARYLPNLFAGAVDDVMTPAALESSSAQLIYHPQAFHVIPVIMAAGKLIVKGAKLIVIAYGLYSTGKGAYGIITDPPTLERIDLHLSRLGIGVRITVRAKPKQLWNAVKTGLGIVSLGKGVILVRAGRIREAATWATKEGFKAIGLDLGTWLVGRLGFEWDREYTFVVDYFPWWPGLPIIRIQAEDFAGVARSGLLDISIAPPLVPFEIRAGKPGWFYTVTIQEMNGVEVNLNSVHFKYYDTGGAFLWQIERDERYFRRFFGTDRVGPKRSISMRVRDWPRPTGDIASTVWRVFGTDANGHRVEASGVVHLQQNAVRGLDVMISSPTFTEGKWRYEVLVSEKRGLRVHLRGAESLLFDEIGQMAGRVFSGARLAEVFGTDTIPAGGYVVARVEEPYNPAVCYLEWVVAGVDENGRLVYGSFGTELRPSPSGVRVYEGRGDLEMILPPAPNPVNAD